MNIKNKPILDPDFLPAVLWNKKFKNKGLNGFFWGGCISYPAINLKSNVYLWSTWKGVILCFRSRFVFLCCIRKGFLDPVYISDFPIRDKKVILVLRRRKWRIKKNNKTIVRDLEIKQSGTTYSKEFAAFLKKIRW